ncbi:exported hypothetical protein [Cupriavidus taiwanensis]|nr:exported hypothetical protein [Cupriavidus taiwanensis]
MAARSRMALQAAPSFPCSAGGATGGCTLLRCSQQHEQPVRPVSSRPGASATPASASSMEPTGLASVFRPTILMRPRTGIPRWRAPRPAPLFRASHSRRHADPARVAGSGLWGHSVRTYRLPMTSDMRLRADLAQERGLTCVDLDGKRVHPGIDQIPGAVPSVDERDDGRGRLGPERPPGALELLHVNASAGDINRPSLFIEELFDAGPFGAGPMAYGTNDVAVALPTGKQLSRAHHDDGPLD